MRVLVAVASRHDATAEIGEAIGRHLADAGLEVEVLAAESVGAVGAYDAVVLGSSVYMGSWLPAATKLVDRFQIDLRERPVWTGPGDRRALPPVAVQPRGGSVGDASPTRPHKPRAHLIWGEGYSTSLPVVILRRVEISTAASRPSCAGCSTSAISRLDMKRPVRTGVPPRVTSLTSTTPRAVVTSIRRPARVASITKVCVPWPVSTTASTRSPFMGAA